jgi:hypothetical protein
VNRLGPRRRSALAGVILGACAIASAAGNESTAALERALAHCAAIAAAGDRLACYDELAAGHTRTATVASPSVSPAASPATSPAASPQGAPTAAKEDFGLSTAQVQKAQPVQKPQIESIKASVAGIGTSSIGRMLVQLDNGQSWELDSADPLLAVGDAVTIARGALGSFLLTTPSRRTHHARRLH